MTTCAQAGDPHRTPAFGPAGRSLGRRGAKLGMAGSILVGTSSWADPGFVKEWYPPGMPARDRLAWYAERFEAVEVNSSFYAVPERSTVRRWAKVTPGRLHLRRQGAPAALAPLGEARVAAARAARGRRDHRPRARGAHPGARAGRGAGAGRRASSRSSEDGQARRLPRPAHAGLLPAQALARRAGRPARGAGAAPGGGRAAPPRLGARRARGRDAALVLRARGGLRVRRRPARRPLPRSCRRSTPSPATTWPTCACTGATPRAT